MFARDEVDVLEITPRRLLLTNSIGDQRNEIGKYDRLAGLTSRDELGGQLDILTLLPGSEIKLVVGDKVMVMGGTGKGDTFHSSSASKMGADGKYVRVRINPGDKAD